MDLKIQQWVGYFRHFRFSCSYNLTMVRHMNNHDGNQIVQVRSYGSSKKLLTLKA